MVAVAILALAFGAISWVAEMRARSTAYGRLAWKFYMSTLRRGHGVRTPDGRWVDSFDNENDLRRDAWSWRIAAKYLRLSYYPWLSAEPDLPPPPTLAQPRRALELPPQDEPAKAWFEGSRPPAWTFLWTWRRPGSPL
jgi:hypothetical protein